MKNLIDSAVAYISPIRGLKRKQARMLYEATTKRSKHFPVGANPNSDNRQAGLMASMARDAEQNHDLASGVLDVLESNTVGTGIKPEPQIKLLDGGPAKAINKAVLEAHTDWAKRPEASRSYNHYESQRLAARSCYRDGEIFCQLVSGSAAKINHRGRVPLSYELIETDYVPRHENNGKNIFEGIQRNSWGEAVAYFVSKDQPYSKSGFRDYYTIPAINMLHYKMSKRVKQGRGITIFHNVINRFSDLKDYEDYERIAAKFAAAITGVIKRDNSDGMTQFDVSDEAPAIGPGNIVTGLQPGEDFSIVSSNRPNNDLLHYRQGNLRAISSGTRAGYSSISKDYNGTYASQRQELVEQHGAYRVMQAKHIDQFENPIYDRFMISLVGQQLINLSGVDFNTLNDVSYEVPQIPWIDPLKEVKAYAAAHENEFLSKNMIRRKLGANPAHVDEQLQDEHENTNQQ